MPLISVLLALIAVAILARIIHIYVPTPGNFKTILNVVLALMAVGMVLWLINTYIPMAGSIRAILNVVVVLATCVGVLQAFGLWSGTVRIWRNFWHGVTTHRPTDSTVPPVSPGPRVS